MRAKAIVFTGIGEVDVTTTEVPDPGDGQVLIETAYSCISPGTELRCLNGHQVDTPRWPYIPGYALTGLVIAAGPNTALKPGTPVFAAGTSAASKALLWGGHISHAVRIEREVFALPDGLDLLDASLARLAAITYHGLRLSHPLPHERVAVVGLGPVGQLTARLHALTGANVVAADRSAARVALARRAGVSAVIVRDTLAAAFAPLFPRGADIVVDATGVPEVLPETLALARDLPWDDTPQRGGRCLIQGSYADSVSIPYQPTFLREMAVLFPRDTQPRDIQAVLDLMRRGVLRVRDLIGDVRPPETAAQTYAELRQDASELATVAFRW